MDNYDESEAKTVSYKGLEADTNVGLVVEVPDGVSAIMLRTSEGKEVVLRCIPYERYQAPQCIDFMTHDPSCEEWRMGRKFSVCVFDEGGWSASPPGKLQSTTASVLIDWDCS